MGGWSNKPKVPPNIPKNKWVNFSSTDLGSFAPGLYGVTLLTDERRIGGITTPVRGHLTAFDHEGKLLLTTFTAPGAKTIFNAFNDNVIRLVWTIYELQAVNTAIDFGYIPVLEGKGLKTVIKGAKEDSVIPGFEVYVVGGSLVAPETEPRIKSLG